MESLRRSLLLGLAATFIVACGPTQSGGTGGTGGSSGTGQTLPPVDDYSKPGPFTTLTIENTGPDGNYTLVRPAALGQNGFIHPLATWGNGIYTNPSLYSTLLNAIASHGFVVIASNSQTVNAALLTSGLDWLIQQNSAAGDLQGKLDVAHAVSIGYSLGGAAAVNAGKHPSVVATISFHGLTGDSASLHGPLLLFTGTADDFVSAAQFVDPTFNASSVQTFYGTLKDANHLYILQTGGEENWPAVAWMRLWIYGDQGAKKYFYGDDCILCKDPWVNPQRKNWP